MNPRSKEKIVVVGAGFGGLNFIQSLGKSDRYEVTLIDKENHHLFQPLLYQVATAGLTPAQIASPIRGVLRQHKNCRVVMDEVTQVNPSEKQVITTRNTFSYDHLVLATGAGPNYFGNPSWQENAPSLKTVFDATQLRKKILESFEFAEEEPSPEKRKKLMTFAVIGAGPTGVEIAGALSELARKTLNKNFRNIDSREAQIFLIEAGENILASFPKGLSDQVKVRLEKMGIQILTNSRVQDIQSDKIIIGQKEIHTQTIIWAAGVKVHGLSSWIDAESDSSGRLKVLPTLNLKEYPNIYVIGDAAHFYDETEGESLPGLAPVAIQQGQYLGRFFKNRSQGEHSSNQPFRYFDKGSLATVGRSFAIAKIGKIHLAGFMAWMIWCIVHILYLIGFRNRFLVVTDWMWSYLTFSRGARLIVRDPPKNKRD